MKPSLRNLQRLLFAIVLAATSAHPSHATDWPQFRGPTRNGEWLEPGTLQTFPPAGLKILWRAPVGAGLSSPIVSHGRVFLFESELKNPKARERVLCFDQKSGQVLWTHADDVAYPSWAFDSKSPAGPDSTPITADGKIYTLGRAGNVSCLDTNDGSPLWRRDLTEPFGSAESFGTTPSLLLEGNLLILVIGGKPDACVLALDKNSGKEVWRALEDTWT